VQKNTSIADPTVGLRTTAGATYDFSRTHQPPANVYRSSFTMDMGLHERSRRRSDYRGDNHVS